MSIIELWCSVPTIFMVDKLGYKHYIETKLSFISDYIQYSCVIMSNLSLINYSAYILDDFYFLTIRKNKKLK